jgi:RNA polymerase sigma factor for flagellar operon FliA
MASHRALSLYKATQSAGEDERITRHMPLVRRLAYHLISRLPASVEVDDLIQAGLIGLMEAARNFDPDAGVQFETFAGQRIRGAMLDTLREADWLPRQVRRNMREIETALHRAEQRLGRAPGEGDVAAELGVPLEEYQDMLGDARGHQLIHLDDFESDDDDHHGLLDLFASDTEADPARKLDDHGFRAELIAGIDALPEREKLVMALYYDEELNLKEIGAVLGVSESRVCQLHSQAIARLRTRLKDWTQ